jgi:hypothetical protein
MPVHFWIRRLISLCKLHRAFAAAAAGDDGLAKSRMIVPFVRRTILGQPGHEDQIPAKHMAGQG